ncbi:PDZ domain-containing protein [Nonlabens sp. Ci31]|uniref:trypsin-like peptidase domain-containing protein n=1 Tax=Nonlabens sp. Ci31 TaxID=2608253 RepID=UPI001463B6DE|nr:trypsin-like peptidase domain-containing protein [Nonlabens sp. Ci31]QJP35368.1 PDZ domain-containing protein [Nonlabens sp. Ci31]
MKSFIKTLGIAILGGAVVLGSYKFFFEEDPLQRTYTKQTQIEDTLSVSPVNYVASTSIAGVDFTEAAEKTVHAVVHVKNKTVSRVRQSWSDLRSGRVPYRETIGSGSGVIITEDGYIVTNNHVIANARELEVTLNNNKTYKAKLIGAEPNSDIALLKIDADEALPYIVFGNSDQTRIGEWVLAVGNPFNLTSTVTAGIISAKGRDLDETDANVQSFIQTDAAVNPGNSGGALVNTNGELIGINTAIASKTGSYVGYSFAVPSNNARKIINDIMEFGFVQKGMLGISGGDLNGNIADELDINESEGIFVSAVLEDSGAARAGLRSGDVITRIDDIKMKKFSDLTGYVNSKNPGDKVVATVLRDQKVMNVTIELTKNSTVSIPSIDMDLRNLTEEDRRQFKVTDGVKIVATTGGLSKYDLRNYIITKINEEDVNDIDDVQQLLRRLPPNGTILIQMKNSAGEVERFRYTMD